MGERIKTNANDRHRRTDLRDNRPINNNNTRNIRMDRPPRQTNRNNKGTKKSHLEDFRLFLNVLNNNKYTGQTTKAVLDDKNMGEVDRIINKGLTVNGLNKRTVIPSALNKIKQGYTKDDARISNLTLTEFAEVLLVDDLGSFLANISGMGMNIGSSLHGIYNSNETVRDIVNGLVDKGYKSLNEYIKPGLGITVKLPRQFSLSCDGYQAVNLAYIFGSLIAGNELISCPDDNPKVVYTNKSVTNFVMVPNSVGNAIAYINTQNFDGVGLVASNAFITYNRANNYNPTTPSYTGLAQYVPGPLSTQSTAGFYKAARRIGSTVEITPFSSISNSEGGYICGMLSQQIISNETSEPLGTTTNLSTADLTALPNFRILDMKTVSQLQMVPSMDSEVTTWKQNGTIAQIADSGKVIVQLISAHSTATLNIKITVGWSVMPSKTSLNFIRGNTPPLGAATDKFCEHLKYKYPDIQNWDSEHVHALYESLSSMGSDKYDVLITCGHISKYISKGIKNIFTKSSPSQSMEIMDEIE